MRISTSQYQFESVIQMLDQQSKLSEIQQKISTGRRILTPSEDPAGAAKILGLNQAVEINEQYQRNASAVTARLETEEITLTSFLDVYQRIRELAIQGLNDTLGQDSRDAIAAEVRQQLSELLGLASRRDPNGEFLFSGYDGNQAPVDDNGSGTYTYDGDQGQRRIAIGPNRSIEDSDNGFDLFFDIDNSAENAFSAVYNFAVGLESGAPDPNALADMDAVMDNIILHRSKIGARLNAVEIQNEVNENSILHSKELLSELEDLDLSEAITELNLRLAGLQAAQQSYVQVQGLTLFNFL